MFTDFLNFQMKLNIQCVSLSSNKSISVVGLAWFNGPIPANRPTLAICFENGWAQIMRNENDDCKYGYLSVFFLVILLKRLD